MSKQKNDNSKLKLALLIATFGTIGVFSKCVPLTSQALCLYRGLIASAFLFLFAKVFKHTFDFKKIKKNLPLLIFVGIVLCANWVFQFEAFRLASIPIGTVCYNTMPIFLIILAPIMFKEKITLKNIVCIIIALIGVVLVSDAINSGINEETTFGSILGIIAAILYALVVSMNKKLEDIDAYDKVTIEFASAGVILIPYILFVSKDPITMSEGISNFQMIFGIFMLLVISIGNTALTYIYYFDLVKKVPAKTVAMYTYIDPCVALILSYIFLHEKLNVLQSIGAILILSATLINEFVHSSPDRANI